ncbi:Immunoglobulin-like domain, partial [Trinorchestia longiramus]
DGQPLPQNHHQEVSSNGSLALTAISRDRSEGRYSCSAYDKQGNSDQGHFDLRVVVPPHLGPLVFPSGTRAGMRAQSSCFVQEGDLPMEIHWEKDGHRLVSAANVK